MYLWDEEKGEAVEATPEQAQAIVPLVAQLINESTEVDVTENPDGTYTHTFQLK